MADYLLKWTTTGVGGEINNSKTLTGDGWTELDFTVADGQTDRVLAFAMDVSQIKAFEIVSDVAVTIETNATNAAGGNTLVLVAGLPYRWCTGWYDSFKFTADVLIAYITNASGSLATLKIRALYDASV